MPKSKLNTEQIIGVLKQVEGGRGVAEVAREVGVSQHTIYAWKAKYGGMEVKDAEELRSLREENHRLKKLVADLSLDKDMLKSVIQKNGYRSRV
jgi:putative transposase